MKIPIEKRILLYSQQTRRYLFAAVAGGFCAAACAVAQAFLLSQVIDRVFLKREMLNGATPLLAILVILALLRAGLLSASEVLAQRAASRLKSGIRAGLTHKIFMLGPAYTQSERSGELSHLVLEGVEALDGYITVYQVSRLLAFSVPVLVLFFILVLDPFTTLVLLFTGPVLVLLMALIGGRVKSLTEKRFLELSWLSAFFLDMLQGLTTLKMFGRSREQVENIREMSQHYGRTTMDVLRIAFQTGLVLDWGGTVATALVAVEVSLRLMNGWMPFDRALAVLIITPEFFLPLRQLALRYHTGTAGKAAAQRILAVLDEPVKPRRFSRGSVVPQRMDIHFDQVDFAYSAGQRPALDGFSLHIPEGSLTALVGASGSGKSTVARLLLRFIDADSGSIRVDGSPLEGIGLSAWREQMAWVPQLPHLFHGTLVENLRIAKPKASQAEIVAAAQAAHADEFIDRLPQRYDTLIGEGGRRLSGGQAQRIAIARAFLKDAPLLILDEATSHLDDASETAVQEALSVLLQDRTVLVIAHRMKLVQIADQVALLERGRVIEAGDPRLLLTRQGQIRQFVVNYEGEVS